MTFIISSDFVIYMKAHHLICSTILALLSFSPSFTQGTVYCVDLDQLNFEQFDLLNQDVKNKKIILVGEMHYMAPNSIIQADLLIHLNKHFGVRHLLIEFGRAEAYLYNQYLHTGDEWYLDHTFHGFSRFKEFYASMKRLYSYNSELDKNKKLVVHGLDFEREPGLSASLYKLLSGDSHNSQIQSLRDSIYIRLDTIGIERDTKEYIYYLRSKIGNASLPGGKNKKLIEGILGNESFVSSMEKRDSLMAESFIALDTTNEVYLGQFGFAHTMLNSANGLAVILNDLKEYHDKILVVNMVYVDSNHNHPLKNISGCPVFLYKIDPRDEEFGGFADRGQWALVLKGQSRYTQRE